MGTLLVDYGKVIDAYPSRDGLATIEDISLSTGGAALNMAVDLRRLGARFDVSVMGCVADDDNGDFIRAACADAGIDAQRVRVRPGATTAFTDVMVERDGGRRTFFTHLGTNALFRAEPSDLAGSDARFLHVGNLGAHPLMDDANADGSSGWSALLVAAQAAGMHTNLELAAFPPDRLAALTGPCLPYLDSIIVNELEASALTGSHISASTVDEVVDWAAMLALAHALLERGVSRLAVVHFPAGCVGAAPDGRTWRQGSVRLPPDRLRSTTGAGDAFAAGVIFGLHEDWSVEASLRLGVTAAAACVQHHHTSNGIMSAETCLAAGDALGYRAT
ncbi:MAG TPA: carbohydrate kinase family protein [Anaerolineae bacterium]|nr:carbohydrate kinase family protein [Anaerolineae bacterium]